MIRKVHSTGDKISALFNCFYLSRKAGLHRALIIWSVKLTN